MHTDQTYRELRDRLTRLENHNRRWKRWTTASLCLTGLGVLGAAATVCDSVSAERFVLRDTRGRERVRLSAYETGGPPRLAFHDQQGKEVFALGVGEDGRGFLEVLGASDHAARSLFSVVDGRAVLEPAKSADQSSAKPDPLGM